MQILVDVQAPPSAQPSQPQQPAAPPSHHVSTSAPATLPQTGRSDVATGALAIGLPAVLLGVVLLVGLRRKRVRTG